MPIEFIETGNQHLDGNGECIWKAPRYNFDTVFYDSTTFDNYDGIGIKLDNDTVLVDFDYHPEIGIEVLRRYPTLSVLTNRGIHLYYRKPKDYKGRIPAKSNVLTTCGALVDYKTGNRTMGTIKTDGELRNIKFMRTGKDGKVEMVENQFPNELSDLPEMPDLLLPHIYSNKKELALSGLGDGDGRNDMFFAHMVAIREKYQYDENKLKEIAEFINERVFATPLPKKEFEATFKSALDRIFSKVDTKNPINPKTQPEKAWRELVRRLDIKLYNGKLYFDKDGVWSNDENLLIRAVFDEGVYLTQPQIKEFLKQASVICERVDDKEFHIQLSNNHMIRNSPQVINMNGGFTPYMMNTAYDPDAYDKHVDEFLDFVTCGDKEIRANIEEMLGHILWTRGFSHKVFFLVNSSGKNGKSTFLKMVSNFVGEPTSKLSIDAFDDSTLLSSLDGKLVNLGDDIDAIYLDKSKNFKTIASGDTITIRAIYSHGFELTNRASLIFTANRMPTFKDKTGGLERRIQIIPFNAHVTKPNPNLDKQLSTENAKSYLLNLALQGLERLQSNNGELTKSTVIEEATQEYFTRSDSFKSFMSEFNIEGNSGDQTYKMYEQYCDVEGFIRPVSKRTFVDKCRDMGFELKKQFKEVKGKQVLITEYTRKEG